MRLTEIKKEERKEQKFLPSAANFFLCVLKFFNKRKISHHFITGHLVKKFVNNLCCEFDGYTELYEPDAQRRPQNALALLNGCRK